MKIFLGFLIFLYTIKFSAAAYIPPPPLTGVGPSRVIPVSYLTYINSNQADSGFYISLLFMNGSDVQVILKNVSLTISVYAYEMSSGAFKITTHPGLDRYALNPDGSISTSRRTSLPEEIPAKGATLLSTAIVPRRNGTYASITTGPYLGQSLTSMTNLINGNDYGGGDFLGYLVIAGQVEVADQNNLPGFLFGYGTILKPSSIGTANISTGSSFVLNGGKPL